MREPIAIVGIGCRFPGAPDPRAFWRLLRDGGDAVGDVPADRWDTAALHDEDPSSPGKTVSRHGGFLDSVDRFDWRAFRIPPREAKYLDPQHRLALEVAWEALEDAGLPFEEVAGSRTGVFLGIMWRDYLRLQARDATRLTGYSATGNGFAFAPNRISYAFDLKGPSVAIDSACAASLAAVHAACQSLWLGESSLALAGGVNLIVSPDVDIMLSRAGVLSPGGRCRTFDSDADGFVRGEGAGLVVLKPRSALTASDRVYGLIRGSALNHNGRNEWIMAASGAAQEDVLREAYRAAGVDPARVDYVELHGTGLPKGDPIEARSLGAVCGADSGRERPCAVGSVKSNIGHLDSAAGIASLIKVALALHHREIPPTLHLRQVNPRIHLDELALAPQTELGPWPDSERPAIAGVTAISMSGVNAHVVVEGAPPNAASEERPPYLLPLSARSPEALAEMARGLRDLVATEDLSLRDICYTAGARRSHHAHRLALVVHSRGKLIEDLDAVLDDRLPPGAYASGAAPDESVPDADEERAKALAALGVLYVSGQAIDWSALFPHGGRCVSLPTYPWQRERLWLDGLDAPAPASTPTLPASDLRRRLAAMPRRSRREFLQALVREHVVAVLGLDRAAAPDPRQGLFDAGLNSLAAVELMNRLQRDAGRPLPTTLVFDYPTIEGLARVLAQTFDPDAARDDDGARMDAILDRLEQLSEEEAQALLLEKLRTLR